MADNIGSERRNRHAERKNNQSKKLFHISSSSCLSFHALDKGTAGTKPKQILFAYKAFIFRNLGRGGVVRGRIVGGVGSVGVKSLTFRHRIRVDTELFHPRDERSSF